MTDYQVIKQWMASIHNDVVIPAKITCTNSKLSVLVGMRVFLFVL